MQLAHQPLFALHSSVPRSTNIRELNEISVLNLLPYYYHRKDVFDLAVRDHNRTPFRKRNV
jgi:hypothetical protein